MKWEYFPTQEACEERAVEIVKERPECKYQINCTFEEEIGEDTTLPELKTQEAAIVTLPH
jgi:hypothetical protein